MTFVKGPVVKHRRSGSLHIYSVPYSEHSSFTELQQFVSEFQPLRIVPTVLSFSCLCTYDFVFIVFFRWAN